MENWEQYQNAYKAANESTKAKIHSSLIPECAFSACTKYELDDSHKRILIRLFADQILGLRSSESTTQSMRDAGIPAAAVIYKEVEKCLESKQPSIPDTSLVENIQIVAEEVSIKSEAISLTVEQEVGRTETASPAANKDSSLAAELAETEAAFKELQPIRTMAHDMETLRTENEPVHKAADQETILNGQGNADKNSDAQWG